MISEISGGDYGAFFRAGARKKVLIAAAMTLAILAFSAAPALAAPEAPVVTTGEAQSITRTSTALSGTVNPEGSGTTYYFAYIDQAGYEKAEKGDAEEKANPYAEGETTAPVKLGSLVYLHGINQPPTFVFLLSYEPQTIGPTPAAGLLPGQTYHYRLVAQNEFEGTVELGYGKDATFATQPGTPPLVTTGGVSAVSQNSATLTGTVTTNGLQTNYGFEIGTEPNNNHGGGWGPITGLGAIGGAQTEEVHVTLGELQPGTTYYYRVTATNADGTDQGQPAVFTTPGFPSLLSTPSSPPLIAYTSPEFPTGSQANTGTTTTPKALTNAQKLAAVLKACKRERKSKRAQCMKQARAKYAAVKKRKRA
jgi:hypothetical protein